jgi:hypothetical protein
MDGHFKRCATESGEPGVIEGSRTNRKNAAKINASGEAKGACRNTLVFHSSGLRGTSFHKMGEVIASNDVCYAHPVTGVGLD